MLWRPVQHIYSLEVHYDPPLDGKVMDINGEEADATVDSVPKRPVIASTAQAQPRLNPTD